MKHFDEITIQKFIDNELSPEERNEVEMHLVTCEECKKQVENQRVFAEKVKDSLDRFVPDSVVIPEFKVSYRPKKKQKLANSFNIFNFNSLRNSAGIFHHQRHDKKARKK